MTSRPKPTVRHIYVIGPREGLQKVGLATDPRARLATLQTGVPFDLVLHTAIAVPADQAHDIERRAHRLLARWCVRNEWFEVDPAEAVAALKKALASRDSRQDRPREWRGVRNERAKMPDVGRLLEAGRRFRPEAAFHRAPEPGVLPLFEYAEQRPVDEQAAVDWALEMLARRIG